MKKLVLMAAVLLGGVAASQAGLNVNIGFDFPRPHHVIIGRPAPCPAPVVIEQAPCPRPVVVVPACPPRYNPAPVVVVPPENCEQPRYTYYERYERHDRYGRNENYDRDDRNHSGWYSENSHRGGYGYRR